MLEVPWSLTNYCKVLLLVDREDAVLLPASAPRDDNQFPLEAFHSIIDGHPCWWQCPPRNCEEEWLLQENRVWFYHKHSQLLAHDAIKKQFVNIALTTSFSNSLHVPIVYCLVNQGPYTWSLDAHIQLCPKPPSLVCNPFLDSTREWHCAILSCSLSLSLSLAI